VVDSVQTGFDFATSERVEVGVVEVLGFGLESLGFVLATDQEV